MPGDGHEVGGDFDAAQQIIERYGYEVVTARPRLSPTERAREELQAMLFTMDRLESAIRCGGALPQRTGNACIDNLVRRLESIRPRAMAEAAD
jgi:hypothetical protein